MKDLAAMFVDAGCDDVRTYIQSGNVVFRADHALAANIPSLIGAKILDRFGYEVPIVTRRARDLDAIVEANPFLQAGAETDRLHVVFLADAPGTEHLKALDPDRSPPDEFAVRGREIYLHCPDGLARRQAHERLLRLPALDGEHDAELEDRAEAPRAGRRHRLTDRRIRRGDRAPTRRLGRGYHADQAARPHGGTP